MAGTPAGESVSDKVKTSPWVSDHYRNIILKGNAIVISGESLYADPWRGACIPAFCVAWAVCAASLRRPLLFKPLRQTPLVS